MTAPTSIRYLGRQNYKFLPDHRVTPITDSVDMTESDILYNNTTSQSTRHISIPTSSSRKKPTKGRNTTSCSLPVNVPDWSKILKSEYKENREFESEDEEFGEEGLVPPHEFLRMRMEGTGVMSMTLKGRALSRVRNAIWEKTGFQD